MIKERAMELVAALRSGKYLQGRCSLRPAEDRYCCLGVACDLAKVEWRLCDTRYSIGSDALSMPPEVQSHFGFFNGTGNRPDGKPIEIGCGEYGCLAEANDEGCTFEQIADYIEANWEHL